MRGELRGAAKQHWGATGLLECGIDIGGECEGREQRWGCMCEGALSDFGAPRAAAATAAAAAAASPQTNFSEMN
jgi:hypothetical protein